MPRLTGKQFGYLLQALLDAFPSLSRLRELCRVRLGKNLDEIALGDSLREIAFKLIESAEAEGWTFQLVRAAREANPGNSALFAFAQPFGLASTSAGRGELERIVRTANRFHDVATWRARLGALEAAVCRVEIASGRSTHYGTGFLVGPDLLLTNHHVLAPVLDGTVPPDRVLLRFDYKQLADGTPISQGTTFRLAPNWNVDASPPSPLDLDPVPRTGVPSEDELDHALVRVDGEPGEAPVGGTGEPGAARRGWVRFPKIERGPLSEGSPLHILQHPSAAPLKLALDTNAILGENANRTRVKYRTNTEPGSSGSPCFDSDWELVALHHAGDPNYQSLHQPEFNQGIPVDALRARFARRGLLDRFEDI